MYIFGNSQKEPRVFKVSPKPGREADEATSYLFAYGSIMRGMERADFLSNKDKARFVSVATTRGRLYDVGTFPGLVLSEPASLVHGELYELFDPATFFETLDLIEGFWPDEPARSLYVRKAIQVEAEGREYRAWSYILNLPTDGLPTIPSGDFRLYHAESTTTQKR